MILLKYYTGRLLLLGAFVSCQNSERQATETGAQLPDSVHCVSDGIPSRASAIAGAEKEYDFLGSDDVKMVWIPGGTFSMGSEEFEDARPVHPVTVTGFWMDEHEVTNAQFARFVEATGFQTIAERPLDPADFPNVPRDM